MTALRPAKSLAGMVHPGVIRVINVMSSFVAHTMFVCSIATVQYHVCLSVSCVWG